MTQLFCPFQRLDSIHTSIRSNIKEKYLKKKHQNCKCLELLATFVNVTIYFTINKAWNGDCTPEFITYTQDIKDYSSSNILKGAVNAMTISLARGIVQPKTKGIQPAAPKIIRFKKISSVIKLSLFSRFELQICKPFQCQMFMKGCKWDEFLFSSCFFVHSMTPLCLMSIAVVNASEMSLPNTILPLY